MSTCHRVTYFSFWVQVRSGAVLRARRLPEAGPVNLGGVRLTTITRSMAVPGAAILSPAMDCCSTESSGRRCGA